MAAVTATVSGGAPLEGGSHSDGASRSAAEPASPASSSASAAGQPDAMSSTGLSVCEPDSEHPPVGDAVWG